MSRRLESQGTWSSSSQHPVLGLGQAPLLQRQPTTAPGSSPFCPGTLEIQVTPCVFFQHMIFYRSALTFFQFLGSFDFHLHLLFPPTHGGFHLGVSFFVFLVDRWFPEKLPVLS